MKSHRAITIIISHVVYSKSSGNADSVEMFSSAQRRIDFELVENASLSSNSICPGGRLSRQTRLLLLRTESVLRARDSMHRNDVGAPFTFYDRGIRFGETAKAQS